MVIQSVMTLLVDSDAFCKLGLARLLPDVAGLFGGNLNDCARLQALPYMLRRGRLRQKYGSEACDVLDSLAQTVPVMASSVGAWLDLLAPVAAIDPGEAQIFARAADTGDYVLTGDKRALRAIAEVGGLAEILAGRVVVLEAVFLALCSRLGDDEMRRRVAPIMSFDQSVQVCFSAGNAAPNVALLSYYTSLVVEVAPLALWDPLTGSES